MSKKATSVKRSAASGRFVTKSLGTSKASKFALVEGVRLNGKSTKAMTTLKSQGLKGDAYRSAVTGRFVTRREK
jgi:hypothetical protein